MNISPVNKVITSKNLQKAGALGVTGVITANALSGKITCKNVSNTTDKDGVRTIHRELPFYQDMVGIFHKKTMDIKIGDGIRTLSETNIDGSNITRIFKSDENHHPTERICTKTDKNGVVEFKSVHTYKDGKTTITNQDFRNNSETVVTMNGYDLERLVKKYDGKTEILEKSPVKGVLNSTIIDKNGNVKIESIGRKNHDGSISVEKDMESPDGTRTKYSYKVHNGSSKLHYQIISKDGESLSTIDREFKRTSPNKAFSSLNGHGYSIESDENGLVITDLVKNETKKLSYDDIVLKDLNKETIEFIKTVPADILLNLQDKGIKFYTVEKMEDGSKFDNTYIKTARNVYTLAHELGHGIDYNRENGECELVNHNPIFRKDFEEEKVAFYDNTTDIEQDIISYFLMDMGGVRGVDGGASESVAESNALMTALPDEFYLLRSHYYQKYFQKSIAGTSKLMLRDKVQV